MVQMPPCPWGTAGGFRFSRKEGEVWLRRGTDSLGQRTVAKAPAGRKAARRCIRLGTSHGNSLFYTLIKALVFNNVL